MLINLLQRTENLNQVNYGYIYVGILNSIPVHYKMFGHY